MKWFKHYSSLHRQPESQATIRKLGYEWYGRYIALLELCAEQYDGEKSSTSITLLVDHLKSTWRVVGDYWLTTLRLLGEYQGFTFEVLGEFIKLEIPILAELHHKDSVSSKARRATLGTVAGRDKTKTRIEQNRLDSITTATLVKVSVAKESRSEPVSFQDHLALMQEIPETTYQRWALLYPDQEFLSRETLKAFNYYENNEVKKPKTIRGWIRALSSWFERGWPKHVSTIKGQPGSNINWEEVFEKGRGNA